MKVCARWSSAPRRRHSVAFALTVAIALLSVIVTPTPAAAAAASGFLSIFGGRGSQPPSADRDAPKAGGSWLFKSPTTSQAPPPRVTVTAAAAAVKTTTEDRRRVPASGSDADATPTRRPLAPVNHPTAFPTKNVTTVRETVTTPQNKLETTTRDRYIITAPLQMCPEGQRMNPDRKCVVNYTDPEEAE